MLGIVDGRILFEMVMEMIEQEYFVFKFYFEKYVLIFFIDNLVDMKSLGFENMYDYENIDVKLFGYELCEIINLKEIFEDNEVYLSFFDVVKDDVFLEIKILQFFCSYIGLFVF